MGTGSSWAIVVAALALAEQRVVPAPTPSPPRTQTPQQVNREIHFQNQCRHPIRLFVYHQHADGNWQTHGWYSIAANVNMTRLESGGRPLVHIEGRPLYFYAEITTPGISYFWQGDTPVTINGVEFRARASALRVADGKFYLWTHCNNLQ